MMMVLNEQFVISKMIWNGAKSTHLKFLAHAVTKLKESEQCGILGVNTFIFFNCNYKE